MDADAKNHARVAKHPVTRLLQRAADGETLYPDELADLRLPDRHRAAFKQAVERYQRPSEQETANARVKRLNGLHSAAEAIVDALPATWEDTETFHQRRAALGDPASQAHVNAQKHQTSADAEAILKGAA